MILCNRCGYCCCNYAVIIVKPTIVKPSLIIAELSSDAFTLFNGDGTTCCPHLTWENNQAVCLLHDYSWFKDLPCHQYNHNLICMIGQYVVKNNKSNPYQYLKPYFVKQ